MSTSSIPDTAVVPVVPTIVIASTETERWNRLVWHIEKEHERGGIIHIYAYNDAVEKRVREHLIEHRPNVPVDDINWRVLSRDDKFPKHISCHPDTAETNFVHFMFGLSPSDLVVNRILEGVVTLYEPTYVDVTMSHINVEGMFDEYAIMLGGHHNS